MFKKIKDRVSGLNVKKKFIFYGYLIITPVLVAVCIGLFVQSYHTSLTEKKERDVSSASNLANNIYTAQEEIKNISTYICINEDVQKLLKISDRKKIESESLNARLWLEKAPMKMVQDMMALKGNIQTIAIYPQNGLRPYLRCVDGSTYYTSIKTVRKTHYYKTILENYNNMMWLSVDHGMNNIYSYTREDKEVFYRTIYDVRLHRVIGIVMIGANKNRFNEMCQNEIKDIREGIIVLDKTGGELIRCGKLDSTVLKRIKNKKFILKNYKKRKNYIKCNGYNIITMQRGANDSIICKVVPKYNIRRHLFDLAVTPALLLLGMLVLLFPLLHIISRVVTKPLGEVTKAIKAFSTGDFNQRVDVTTNDEIGEVANCFNKMVNDIKSLIDENYVITIKERESELNALQSQINPHFLYNTLDSLYWQATEKDQEDLADSILALSDLFKLVLSRGSSMVTVEKELELIDKYLQIQKMRFSKRLEYEIVIEESVRDNIIPKLIIQPFVENAIVHGLENITTTCVVKVFAKKAGGYLHFEISDTGIGMTESEVKALWEENKQYANQRIGRYAIKNIQERLAIKYNNDFKLDIESEKGKGTKVIIEVPIQKENEEE